MIDRDARTRCRRWHGRRAYDKLLIATGSDPFIMPVPGKDLPGVVTFRDLDDVEAMLPRGAAPPAAPSSSAAACSGSRRRRVSSGAAWR